MKRARADAVDAIPIQALEDALGGFEVRDEAVVLDRAPRIGLAGSPPRTAICAGVDGDRRAVIVVRARRQEAILAAIDALAWCDARGDLLARRLGADPDRTPCVVLIVDDLHAETTAALATLRTAGLRVFEARCVQSSRGTEQDLAEVERAEPADDSGSSSTSSSWPQRLDGARRDLYERIQAAMARIDPEARAARTGRAIVWRSGTARLVELSASGDTLQARVGDEHFELGAPGDVERVLEGAMRALLAAGDPVDEDDDRTGQDAHAVLMPAGPLLSADELAALSGE